MPHRDALKQQKMRKSPKSLLRRKITPLRTRRGRFRSSGVPLPSAVPSSGGCGSASCAGARGAEGAEVHAYLWFLQQMCNSLFRDVEHICGFLSHLFFFCKIVRTKHYSV